MRKTLLRAGALTCALMTTTCLTAPAFAQTEPTPEPPPPVRSAVDENGVDVTTGALNLAEPGVSIGPAFPHGLSYSNQAYAGGMTPGAVSSLQRSGSTYVATVAGDSDSFTLSGSTFTPTEANGSSLSLFGAVYTYTSHNGVIATFQAVTAWGQPFTRPQYVQFPDGTRVVYSFRFVNNYCPGGEEGGICPWDGGRRTAYRLQSITNNHGYQLKLTYQTNTLNDLLPGTSYEDWTRLTTVTALNNAVDYCDPTADSCTGLTQTWPSVSYAESSSSRTITDPAGQDTLYTFGSGTGGIRLPGSTSDDITITSGSNGVSSLTRFGTTYSYSVSTNGAGTERTTTVTDPDNETRVYVTGTDTATTGPMRLLRFTDELSRQTSYSYDSNGRLTGITYPGGNSAQFTYDARGNVTETRRVASGSGLPDIVASASYDSSCSNALTCNQPNSTTDALGHTTYYTYDSGHGGVLTVTAPDPATGAACPASGAVCPQSRTTYAARQAYYRQASSGGPTAASVAVTVPTQVSTCASGNAGTCVGTTAETRTTIDWGPQTSGTANNLLPVSTTVADGTGALSATSAATYDMIGNLLTVDGPLSGTDDTTTLRYDVLRRRVGVISPDPDGGGSMLRRARRTTYASSGTSQGQVSQVDQGTVAGTSDSNWAAFSTLQSIAMTYDGNRRMQRQRLLNASGGTEAVRDLSYDALARPDCATIRMDPSTWSTVTAACTQQSAGTDRITQTSYDAASQPTQTEEGHGTSLATTVATRTYTANGRPETLTDGEGNRSTFVYDGHDRLSRTRMPNTTQGAGTSSTTDYEELTYETHASATRTSGQVASRRLRDGNSIAFGYDSLGRLTTKNLPGSELDVTYGYDLLGRMTSAATSAQTVSFTFDALGRNLDQTGPNGTIASQYDLAGQRTRVTWPGGFYAGYDHLVTGEVSAVRENGSSTTTCTSSNSCVLASYAYDNLGRRTGVTRGNGTSTAYSYDAASRLSQLVENLDGSTYDLTLDFTYNPASQIASVDRSNYQFSFFGLANANVTNTHNGLNQATGSGSTSLTHDARGNTTAIGSASYGYSSENLMTSGPNSTTLSYDPLTRLYQVADGSSTTRFAYDGATMAGEYDGSGTAIRRYVHGPGVDEPIVWYQLGDGTERRFLHADERGSIIAVTTNSGTMIGGGNYDENGNPQSGAIAGRFGYTGQAWLSQLGMWYYRARVYNPGNNGGGRFMQTDPIGYDGGINLYAYVGGDPVNLSDPSGLCTAVDVAHMDRSAQCAQLGYDLDEYRRRSNSNANGWRQRCVGYGTVWSCGFYIEGTLPSNSGGSAHPSGDRSGSGSGGGQSGQEGESRTCQNIRRAVQQTQGNLPGYITNTWRWDNAHALGNDLITARLNLADANDLSSLLTVFEWVGAAASARGGPVGAAAGGAAAFLLDQAAGSVISAEQDRQRSQIAALQARITQIQAQEDNTCS